MIHVSKGTYRAAGQCEKKRGVKRIQLGDTAVLACKPHRKVIEGGKKAEVAKR